MESVYLAWLLQSVPPLGRWMLRECFWNRSMRPTKVRHSVTDIYVVRHMLKQMKRETAATFPKKKCVHCTAGGHGGAADWRENGIPATSYFNCEWAGLPKLLTHKITSMKFCGGQSVKNLSLKIWHWIIPCPLNNKCDLLCKWRIWAFSSWVATPQLLFLSPLWPMWSPSWHHNCTSWHHYDITIT